MKTWKLCFKFKFPRFVTLFFSAWPLFDQIFILTENIGHRIYKKKKLCMFCSPQVEVVESNKNRFCEDGGASRYWLQLHVSDVILGFRLTVLSVYIVVIQLFRIDCVYCCDSNIFVFPSGHDIGNNLSPSQPSIIITMIIAIVYLLNHHPTSGVEQFLC